MLTLYGSARGRASRSLLALEELAIPYRHAPLRPWAEPADRETLLRLNPNARVPVLTDGDLVLWESMAINLYLAARAGRALWPGDAGDRGRIYQWSFWAQTEIDVSSRHTARIGGDLAAKAAAQASRLSALTVLDRALEGRRWLVGEAFTIADLNLAATLSEPWENGLIDGDLDPAAQGLANVADWLARCQSRPAWERVRALP